MWKKSWLTTPLVIALLCGGGAAFAATGVVGLPAGEGTHAGAKTAQEPLGSLSSTPPASVDKGGVRGDNAEGVGPIPPRNGSASSRDGTGENLPFTGFFAITALLTGIGLLVAGLSIQRRASAARSA